MDRHRNDLPPTDIDLGTLMRRLPDASPPDDAWQRLSARARQRHRQRRAWRVGGSLALAASLAALALTMLLPSNRQAKPTATTQVASTQAADAGAATATTVRQLRERSHRLEGWVRQLRTDSPPLAGAALAQRTALENQIALIDQQLGSTSGNDDRSLWQQRVDRLQRIALLQLTSNAVASSNGQATPPDVWVN